jgi:hypothetical protein
MIACHGLASRAQIRKSGFVPLSTTPVQNGCLTITCASPTVAAVIGPGTRAAVGETARPPSSSPRHSAYVDVGGNQDELVGECRNAVKVLR